MTDSDSIVADTHPTPAPPAAPRPRRGPGLFLVALVLLLAVGAAWVLWQQRSADAQREHAAWQQRNAELLARIDALDEAIAQVRRGQQANAERLDASTATNRVLREELLAMGERAALLEDAVARLADQRLRGETVLRLNEAEFLLLLGAERLQLFGDPAAAIQAFSLAEASLASLDDPGLATLRQTLAQELIELRGVPPDPRPQLRAELARLSDRLAALPPSQAGEIATTDARDSRLVRLLSRLVTVRRVAGNDVALGPLQRDAALAAVRLQAELAQAALAKPDPQAFRAAMAQIATASERLFTRDDPAAADYFATLERLRSAELLPTLPALGATLQELRALRATRTVGSTNGADTPATPADKAAPAASPSPDALLPEPERTAPPAETAPPGDVE